MQKTMPRSTKKFVRRQKAAIRRQFLDVKKQNLEIAELYKKILNLPVLEESKPEEASKKPVVKIEIKKPKSRAPKGHSKLKTTAKKQ